MSYKLDYEMNQKRVKFQITQHKKYTGKRKEIGKRKCSQLDLDNPAFTAKKNHKLGAGSESLIALFYAHIAAKLIFLTLFSNNLKA